MIKISELMPPIKCVPITEPSYVLAVEKIELAEKKGADAIELRADFLDYPEDVFKLYNVCNLPTIITCRRSDDGGRFKYKEKRRLELLKRAAKYSTTDLEYEYVPKSMIEEIRRRYKDSEIIRSKHFFNGTPEIDEIIPLVIDMERHGDIVKVVSTLHNENDLKKWAEWTSKMKKILDKPFISFAMDGGGNAGLSKISRLITYKLGGILSFFSVEGGKESAPGQVPIDEADEELSKVNYGVEIDLDTILNI